MFGTSLTDLRASEMHPERWPDSSGARTDQREGEEPIRGVQVRSQASMGNGGGGTQRTGGVQPRGRPAVKWTWGLRRISGLVWTFTSCGIGQKCSC